LCCPSTRVEDVAPAQAGVAGFDNYEYANLIKAVAIPFDCYEGVMPIGLKLASGPLDKGPRTAYSLQIVRLKLVLVGRVTTDLHRGPVVD